jgi:hypothetical protein
MIFYFFFDSGLSPSASVFSIGGNAFLARGGAR